MDLSEFVWTVLNFYKSLQRSYFLKISSLLICNIVFKQNCLIRRYLG